MLATDCLGGGLKNGVMRTLCRKLRSRVMLLGAVGAYGVEVPRAQGFALPLCFVQGAGEMEERAGCKGKEREEEEMKTN